MQNCSQSQHPVSQPSVSQQSAQPPPNSINPNVPSSGPIPGKIIHHKRKYIKNSMNQIKRNR